MESIEDFFVDFDYPQSEVIEYLHNYLTNHMNLMAKIRYGLPFYYGKSWICYLSPQKSGAIELSFLRGNELSNEQGLLESKGRKQVKSIVLENIKKTDENAIKEIIMEAIILDQSIPYKSKRNAKNKK
jgi:hypothetical protein